MLDVATYSSFIDYPQRIVPPSCIGIMGGGQLARMLAISAREMGYEVAILEPDNECPAKHFANYHIKTDYNNIDGLEQLAKISSVITTEFENVPASSMEYLANLCSTYPNSNAISICQNRLLEKNFFNSNGITTVKFIAINNLDDIKKITPVIFPAILKTNTLGYDGKNQIRVNNLNELLQAFDLLKQQPSILEKLVDLKAEASIMVARNPSNEISCFPVCENIHKNGILDITIAPARIDKELQQKIKQLAEGIIKGLDYIGILGIEFFITNDNQILANEMAPRPHNSGHYTIDACSTSQFEQQLRAICNLKLGDSSQHSFAIMLNLMGDIWQSPQKHPNWQKILEKFPNLKLHLYDKKLAKPGRKMGHLTIVGDDLKILYKQIQVIATLLNQ